MSVNTDHADVKSSQVVKVSAPGKVILYGEHSVVYGKRAIALSVDLRCHAKLTTGGSFITLDFPDVNAKQSWPLETVTNLWKKVDYARDGNTKELTKEQSRIVREFLDVGEEVTDPLKLALLCFLHLYLSILPQPVPLAVLIDSQSPIGAGLGSSASYAVCLSAAFLQVAGAVDLSQLSSSDTSEYALKTVCEWAFSGEKIVHGTPSGIDNTVCTYGKAVSFISGVVHPIQMQSGVRVLLVNTKVPRSTKALVSGVRERKAKLPKVMEPILGSMGELANRAHQILQDLVTVKDDAEYDSLFGMLEELVDINQALLCALGVSHPSLDRLVAIARSHGLHAKLTGAGGGGFGLVLVPNSISESIVDACCKELKQSSYEVWSTYSGAPGLMFHHD